MITEIEQLELDYLRKENKELRELLSQIVTITKSENNNFLQKDSVIIKVVEMWLEQTDLS